MPAFRSGSKLLALATLSALALAPVPALARDTADDDFASELENPRTQQAMGDMLGAMLGAMLNLKAAPLAKAMERMGDAKAARKIPEGATLGDLAGKDARKMPDEVRRRVPMMMGAMGELSGLMKEMAPQLEAMGKDFARQMEQAKAGADQPRADEPPAGEATEE
jgi:hypothetical protein